MALLSYKHVSHLNFVLLESSFHPPGYSHRVFSYHIELYTSFVTLLQLDQFVTGGCSGFLFKANTSTELVCCYQVKGRRTSSKA